MNSCNFVGRLTAEIELRRTGNGKAVASYSLAVKRPRVSDTTDFIEFVSWEQGAEYLAKYATKGDIVAACGTLQPRKWTDKDGKERKAWEVVTTSVELLSNKKNSEASSNTTQNGFQGYQPQQPHSYQNQQGTPPAYLSQQQAPTGPQYNQQGFGSYQQAGFQGQSYQPPQGNFAPIVDDDPKLPF